MRNQLNEMAYRWKDSALATCEKLKMSPRTTAFFLGGVGLSISVAAISAIAPQTGSATAVATGPCSLVTYVTDTTQKTMQMASSGIGGTDSRKYFDATSGSGCLKLITTLPIDMSMGIPDISPTQFGNMATAAAKAVSNLLQTQAGNLASQAISDVTGRFNNLLSGFSNLGTLFDSTSQGLFNTALSTANTAATTTVNAAASANTVVTNASNAFGNAAAAIGNAAAATLPADCFTTAKTSRDQAINDAAALAMAECQLNGCPGVTGAVTYQQQACAIIQIQQWDAVNNKWIWVNAQADAAGCTYWTNQVPILQTDLSNKQGTYNSSQSTADSASTACTSATPTATVSPSSVPSTPAVPAVN